MVILVLLINQEIKDAISSGIRRDALRELVYKSDVITMLQDGLEKVASGMTTFEELLKLIELDDDDAAGKSSLEQAINYTNIANGNENKQPIKEEVKQAPVINAFNQSNNVGTPNPTNQVNPVQTPSINPVSQSNVTNQVNSMASTNQINNVTSSQPEVLNFSTPNMNIQANQNINPGNFQ